MQQIRRHSSLTAAVGGLSVSTLRTISSSNPQLAQPPPQWMLFNDFVIRKTLPAEVQATYAGQKTPCMLYYTRVGRLSLQPLYHAKGHVQQQQSR